MPARQATPIDQSLIDATSAAIARWGLVAVTLERIADEAGISRATMYRRGVSREDLVGALTVQAAETYRRAMMPVLTHSGSARERLRLALYALCQTADEHLGLLGGLFLAQGEVFHQPGPNAMVVEVFAEPFERLLRDGAVDGSLRATSPTTTATVLFNAVGWAHIHLRAAHQWESDTSADAVVDLVLNGLMSTP